MDAHRCSRMLPRPPRASHIVAFVDPRGAPRLKTFFCFWAAVMASDDKHSKAVANPFDGTTHDSFKRYKTSRTS